MGAAHNVYQIQIMINREMRQNFHTISAYSRKHIKITSAFLITFDLAHSMPVVVEAGSELLNFWKWHYFHYYYGGLQ